MGELVVILLLILVLFGANRLPQAGAGLGKAIRSFKDAMAGKGEHHAGGAGNGEHHAGGGGKEGDRGDPGEGKAP